MNDSKGKFHKRHGVRPWVTQMNCAACAKQVADMQAAADAKAAVR